MKAAIFQLAILLGVLFEGVSARAASTIFVLADVASQS
jgi:hypothetical protein